jgi:hypothetical protein
MIVLSVVFGNGPCNVIVHGRVFIANGQFISTEATPIILLGIFIRVSLHSNDNANQFLKKKVIAVTMSSF